LADWQLVCARANFYFNPALNFADNSTVASGGEAEFDLDKWQQGYGAIHQEMQNSMFFV
jgi:eukaryotic translation initiation factor 2C